MSEQPSYYPDTTPVGTEDLLGHDEGDSNSASTAELPESQRLNEVGKLALEFKFGEIEALKAIKQRVADGEISNPAQFRDALTEYGERSLLGEASRLDDTGLTELLEHLDDKINGTDNVEELFPDVNGGRYVEKAGASPSDETENPKTAQSYDIAPTPELDTAANPEVANETVDSYGLDQSTRRDLYNRLDGVVDMDERDGLIREYFGGENSLAYRGYANLSRTDKHKFIGSINAEFANLVLPTVDQESPEEVTEGVENTLVDIPPVGSLEPNLSGTKSELAEAGTDANATPETKVRASGEYNGQKIDLNFTVPATNVEVRPTGADGATKAPSPDAVVHDAEPLAGETPKVVIEGLNLEALDEVLTRGSDIDRRLEEAKANGWWNRFGKRVLRTVALAVAGALTFGIAGSTPNARADQPERPAAASAAPIPGNIEASPVGEQAKAAENAESVEQQKTESLRMDRETAKQVIDKFSGDWHRESSLAAGFNGDVRTEQGMKDFREYVRALVNTDAKIAAQIQHMISGGDIKDIKGMNTLLDSMNKSSDKRQEVVDEVLKFVENAEVSKIEKIGENGASYYSTYDKEGKLGVAMSGYNDLGITFVYEDGRWFKISDGCEQVVGESVVAPKTQASERVIPKKAKIIHEIGNKKVVVKQTFTKKELEEAGVHVPEVKPKPVETEITHEKPTGESPDEEKPETPVTPSEPPETPTTETKGDIHGGSGAQDIPPPPPEQGEKTNPTTGQTTPAKFKETPGSSIRPTDGPERTAVAPRSEPASEQDRQSVTAPKGGEGQQNPNSGTVEP